MAWFHISNATSASGTYVIVRDKRTRSKGYWFTSKNIGPGYNGASISGGASITFTSQASAKSSTLSLRTSELYHEQCIIKIDGIAHLRKTFDPFEDSRIAIIKRVHPVMDYPSPDTRGTP